MVLLSECTGEADVAATCDAHQKWRKLFIVNATCTCPKMHSCHSRTLNLTPSPEAPPSSDSLSWQVPKMG